MMTIDEAKTLRERFYEGALSQTETARLARFMLSDDCPADWRAERPLFASSAADIPLPEGFMQRLEEHVATTVATAPAVRPRRRTWRIALTGIAAAAAVVLWLAWPAPEGTDTTTRTSSPIAANISPKPQPTAPAAEATTEAKPKTPSVASAEPQRTEKRARRRTKARRVAVSAIAQAAPDMAATPADTSSIYITTAHTPEEAEKQMGEIAAAIEKARRSFGLPLASINETLESYKSAEKL